MYCTGCGKALDADERSCSRCGANLMAPGTVRMTPPTTARPDAGSSFPDPVDQPTAIAPAARPTEAGGASASGSAQRSVWDRFMREPAPGAATSSAATGASASSVDDATHVVAGGPSDQATARFSPAPQVRDVSPPTRVMPVAGASVASGATARDATVGDLPPEWFRPEGEGAAPTRVVAAAPVARPAMVDAAPGQPPAPPQRQRHERLSASTVLVVSLIPVLVVAVLAWRVMHARQSAQSGPTAVAATTSHATRAATTAAPTAAPTTRMSAPATSASPLATSASRTPSPSASAPASSATATSNPPSGTTACGTGVWAGAGTSCGFAKVVAAAVGSSPASSFTIRATSPVTRTSYTMTCQTAGGLTTCTGGRAAAVYVRT